jgi:hypothetical protein
MGHVPPGAPSSLIPSECPEDTPRCPTGGVWSWAMASLQEGTSAPTEAMLAGNSPQPATSVLMMSTVLEGIYAPVHGTHLCGPGQAGLPHPLSQSPFP